MAAPIVERLRFLLSGDAKSLNKALRDAKKRGEDAAQGIAAEFLLAKVETDALAESLGGVLQNAARRATAVLVENTRAAIDQAATFQKLAQQAGVTVERYSTLSFAARQNRLTQEQFEQALKGVQTKVREAEQDTTLAAQAFKALGVETKTATGEFKDTDALLLELADAFTNIEDGTAKGAAAIGLFEESGRRLIPFLNLGSEGIKELEQRARDLGLEVSTQFAQDATVFSDQLQTLEERSVALGRVIGTAVVPELNKLVKLFLDGAAAGNTFKGASDAILTGLEDLVRTTTGLDLKLTVDTEPTALDRLLDARERVSELREEVRQAEADLARARNAPAFRLGIVTAIAENAEQRLGVLRDQLRGNIGLVEELESAEAKESAAARANVERAVQARANQRDILEALGEVQREQAREAQEAAKIQERLDRRRAEILERVNEAGDDPGARRAALAELRAAEQEAAEQKREADAAALETAKLRKEVTADLIEAEKELADATKDTAQPFRAPRREQLQLPGQSERDLQRRLQLESRAVQTLEQQVTQTGALTQAERVRRSIANGAFAEFSQQAQTRLLLLAEELDLQKEQAALREAERGEREVLADLQNKLELERQVSAEQRARLELEQGLAQGVSVARREELEAARALAEEERIRLAAAQEFATFRDEERRKRAEDLRVEIEQERLRREQDEEAAKEAARLREEQARQVQNVLESVKSLEEAEREEIETIRQLALVNEEVRAVQGQAIDRVREKFRGLRDGASKDLITMADIGRQSAQTLQKGFADFLIDPLNNSFDDLLQNWLQTIQRMAAEGLAQELFGGLAGGGGGGGGGGLLGGLFGGLFAEGGPVHGPGTSTSDSIPARLSDGEYVVRAAAVRQYGAGMLEAINRGLFPRRGFTVPQITAPRVPRFATGGIVERPAESAQVNVPLRVVNLLDPKNITDEMDGSEGERVVLNHIRANAGAIKQILGSG